MEGFQNQAWDRQEEMAQGEIPLGVRGWRSRAWRQLTEEKLPTLSAHG